MARILLCGTELRLLGRWSQGVQSGGHDARIAPLASLQTADSDAGEICLVDLGSRRGADAAALLSAAAMHPGTAFVAMTARPDAGEGLTLLRAGVRGYANRLASPDVIAALLDSLLAGEIWAGREVTQHLLANALAVAPQPEPASTAVLAKLTPREAEIAWRVAAGDSNKEIAADHGISERTVKAHLNSIFRKTGVRNRVRLALVLNQGESGSPRRSNG